MDELLWCYHSNETSWADILQRINCFVRFSKKNVVKCAWHSTGPCEHAHTGHEHVLFESSVRHGRLLQFSRSTAFFVVENWFNLENDTKRWEGFKASASKARDRANNQNWKWNEDAGSLPWLFELTEFFTSIKLFSHCPPFCATRNTKKILSFFLD